jgi:hypothetical protein
MPRITEMFAFVVEDTGPDDEGIVAHFIRIGATTDAGYWMPLVGADPARVASLMPLAQEVADRFQKPVRILRFTTRGEFGIIAPAPFERTA